MKWVAALVGVLVFASSAQAATVISEESGTRFPYQRWVVRAALPTPPITIRVAEEPCPFMSAPACTEPGGPIYMDPAAFTTRAHERATFMHELGHQYDYTRLADANRARFMAIYGLVGPWYQPDNPDYSTNPAERFADRYSILALLRGEDQGRGHMHAVRRMIRAIG